MSIRFQEIKMSCSCNLRKRITENKIDIDKRDVYLDYNATTKPDIKVLAEVDKLNRNSWGNPSAQNSRGVHLYNILLEKINKCKNHLSAKSYYVYFDTSSTSIIKKIYKSKKDRSIYTSNIEHKSLLENSDNVLPVDINGRIDLEYLTNNQHVAPECSILIFSPVNHETGNIQPYKEIYKICKSKKIDVIFDAVQTVSRIKLEQWRPYCDGFYYSGHKIHGLQGAAVLFIDNNIDLFDTENSPLPFSIYSGTFNTCSVIALLESTEILFKYPENLRDLQTLHKEAINIIMNIKDVNIESSINGAPGIINISLPPNKSIENLLLFLNKNGIQLSRFSACTDDINGESYVLKNMGRDINRCKSSLRLSFGKYSKRDDFFRVTSSINKYYNEL